MQDFDDKSPKSQGKTADSASSGASGGPKKILTGKNTLLGLLQAHQDAAEGAQVVDFTEKEVVETTTELTTAHKAALFDLLLGLPPQLIAAEQETEWPTFQAWLKSPLVVESLRKASRQLFERVQRGEFGPIPIAKVEAEEMMRILIRTAKNGKSDETKRKAANDVLNYAGHLPSKRPEDFNANDFLAAMSFEELKAFADHGEVPDRLRDKAAFLVTSGMSKGNQAVDITPSNVATSKQ